MVLKAKTANRIIFDTGGYVTATLIEISRVPDYNPNYSQVYKPRFQFEFKTMGTLRPIRQIVWTNKGFLDICLQLNVISIKDLRKDKVSRYDELLDELKGTTFKYKLRQKRLGNRPAAIDLHSLVRV